VSEAGGDATGGVDVAVDNDILIKAAAYGLTEKFWESAARLGVLGAARFVVASRIKRVVPAEEQERAVAAAAATIASAVELEPVDAEIELASEFEAAAQRRGVALDTGESQLVAMVITRAIPVFETGDKRAMRALEAMLDELAELAALQGKVRCLEQVVAGCLARGASADDLATAICGKPDVDKTLSICFRCFSPPPQGHALDPEALVSYIANLRGEAPRVLAP
jgi:hypothetical protein